MYGKSIGKMSSVGVPAGMADMVNDVTASPEC